MTCSAFNRCRGSFLSHDNVRGHLRPCALITRRSIRSRDRGEDDDPRRTKDPSRSSSSVPREKKFRKKRYRRSIVNVQSPPNDTEIFLNHASERNVVLLSFTNIPSFLSFLRPLLSLFLFFFSHASRDILKPFFALIVFDFRPIKVDPAHRARAARLHGELISPRWIRERLRLPSLVRNIPFPSLRNDEEAARPSLRGFLLTCPPPLSRALHSKKYYLSASCHINSPSTR